jgi:hypothetical protein
MSRVKDPIEKKRLSLARDHRVFALEGNKTFRKAWRLKKARAARKLRREKKVDQSAPKPKRPSRAEKSAPDGTPRFLARTRRPSEPRAGAPRSAPAEKGS